MDDQIKTAGADNTVNLIEAKKDKYNRYSERINRCKKILRQHQTIMKSIGSHILTKDL